MSAAAPPQAQASGAPDRSSSDFPKQSRGPGRYEKRHYPKKTRNNNKSRPDASSSSSTTTTGQANNESGQQRHQESASTSSGLPQNDAANVPPQWFSSYLESMKQQIITEVTSNISKLLKSHMTDEEERRRHAASFFGLKKRYHQLEDELANERKKNGNFAPVGRTPSRYGYNARKSSHDHNESSRNQQFAGGSEGTAAAARESESQIEEWEIVGYDKEKKTVKLSFLFKGTPCTIDLAVSSVWSNSTGQTVGQVFAEQIKAFDDDDEKKDQDEKEEGNVVGEKKQDVEEGQKESCQENDKIVDGESPLDYSKTKSINEESLSHDSSSDLDKNTTSQSSDKEKIELATKVFIEKIVEQLNEGLSKETFKKLHTEVMKESRERSFTENDLKKLANEFVDRVKGSSDIADEFGGILGKAVDLSPVSINTEKIMSDAIEEKINGGASLDAVLMISAMWSERLVSDDFVKKCIERFLKTENETEIECLCELLTAVGEDVTFWKKFGDLIDDMKKKIDEGSNQDERIVTAINRALRAVIDTLDD